MSFASEEAAALKLRKEQLAAAKAAALATMEAGLTPAGPSVPSVFAKQRASKRRQAEHLAKMESVDESLEVLFEEEGQPGAGETQRSGFDRTRIDDALAEFGE